MSVPNHRGFIFLDILLGLFVFLLLSPLFFTAFNRYSIAIKELSSSILNHTELDFIRDAMTQDLESSVSVLTVDESILELLSDTGKIIRYSVINNKLRRQNGRSTRYITQFLSCTQFLVEKNGSLLRFNLHFVDGSFEYPVEHIIFLRDSLNNE